MRGRKQWPAVASLLPAALDLNTARRTPVTGLFRVPRVSPCHQERGAVTLPRPHGIRGRSSLDLTQPRLNMWYPLDFAVGRVRAQLGDTQPMRFLVAK